MIMEKPCVTRQDLQYVKLCKNTQTLCVQVQSMVTVA